MDELINIPCPSCGHLLNEYWVKSSEGVAKLNCADCNVKIEGDFKIIFDVKNIRIGE